MTIQVLFNEPIFGEIKAPTPAVKTWSYNEILELTARYAKRGWSERAVVVLSGHTDYYNAQPMNWGVVTLLRKHPGITGEPYMPLQVQWINQGSISKHWPEDLFFIHLALDKTDIDDIIKGQNK